MDRLRREDIVHALESLARELPAAAKPLEMVVVGGAALVLLYGARETTKDVDAFLIETAGVPAVRMVPGRELKGQYAFLDLGGAHRAP